MSTLVDLTKSLISIPSVSGEGSSCHTVLAKASAFISPDYRSKQFQHRTAPSTLFYSSKYSYKTKWRVLLNAHLDVVPAPTKLFKPRVTAGKIFGRGAQDMKSGAAVMIKVFNALADEVAYPLALQLVTDEEIGGVNGVAEQLKRGVHADFTISGESTQLDIVHKAKGIMRVKLQTKGKAAHSAYPWNGSNAIELMNTVIATMKNQFAPISPNMWKSTMNVATIQTPNSAANVIPDQCTAVIDIRFVPEDEKRLEQMIKKLNTQTVTANLEWEEPSHNTDLDNPDILTLKNIVTKSTKKKAVVRGAHGASDLRHFDERGMYGVEFGPCGGGLHTDSEWCDIQSLTNYQNILTEFLLSVRVK